PEDSVFLSWWDYGYHIESIGERGAVADGGNRGFMTKSGGNKLPLNLADFFTSTDYNRTHILEKHSADYIILDQPMVGKYGAVSRIANRDSRNESVQLLSFSSSNTGANTVVGSDSGPTNLKNYNGSLNDTKGTLTLGNRVTGYQMNVPVNITEFNLGRRSIRTGEITEAPSLSQGSNIKVPCRIRDDGTIKEYDVENPLSLGQFGEMCIAEDPYYSLDRGLSSGGRTSLVLVPRKVADNIFMQLMFGDGEQIDWAEKIEEGSNGYVQIWKVNKGE
ncbi:MAG: hypothetical protein BRC30_00750, partial [Nanohaloarchaea archaeon SW_7_46_7]